MQLLSKETTIRDSYRTPMTPRYNKMIYLTIQFKSYIETKVCTERRAGQKYVADLHPSGGGGRWGNKIPEEFLLTMTTLSDHRPESPQTRPALRRPQSSSGEPCHHPSY